MTTWTNARKGQRVPDGVRRSIVAVLRSAMSRAERAGRDCGNPSCAYKNGSSETNP